MKEGLCITCKPEKTCRFMGGVNSVINSVLPDEEQTPIKSDNNTTNALWINEHISNLRDMARDLACPNVNINPDYPDRKNL